MNTKKIGQEVEKTLSILSKNQRKESNPYTYNKVLLKLSRNGREKEQKNYSILIEYSLLTLFIIINLITIIKINFTNEFQKNDIKNKTETLKNLESIANEYNLFINY